MEILNTTINHGNNYDAILTLLAVVIITAFILGLFLSICGEFAPAFICCIIIIGSVMISNYILKTNQYEYKEYQVTIDNTVKISDFIDKYTIVSHDGKIYTIVKNEDAKYLTE